MLSWLFVFDHLQQFFLNYPKRSISLGYALFIPLTGFKIVYFLAIFDMNNKLLF